MVGIKDDLLISKSWERMPDKFKAQESHRSRLRVLFVSVFCRFFQLHRRHCPKESASRNYFLAQD